MSFAFRVSPKKQESLKKGILHPRNQHQGRYDFERLIHSSPALAPFVTKNKYGDLSIDFSNPSAVKNLNRALLSSLYGVQNWDIPADYLCPPVPGRSDYIHSIADLLSTCNQGVIPRGKSVRVLDVGVGASCIYPVIGYYEYGWSFIGSDIDTQALNSAKKILAANPVLLENVELRLQKSSSHVFTDLIQKEDFIDFSICNPPFHSSLIEARRGTLRKWNNLGLESKNGKERNQKPVMNFGGQTQEITCLGGEIAFILRMIKESWQFRGQVLWFSTLVSNKSALPELYDALENAEIFDSKTIDMEQGQKKSRILTWTYQNSQQQQDWKKSRFKRLS